MWLATNKLRPPQTSHMNKANVSIVKIDDYDYTQICIALERGIELVGGLEKIIKPGKRVFVKINHLSPPSPAEIGIVTHPIFVEAVLELLKRVTGDITVGDDIDSADGDGFQVSGFRQMCKRAGVRLVNLREAGFMETRCNGHLLEKVYLSKVALDADVIINLPKLKTHSLTVLTGGVKNMYGIIPNGLRRRLHFKYMRSEDFGQVLTDIFSAIKPHLTVMDGVVAMEGEGPSSGRLRRLGVILASQDAVALDAIATKIIGLEPADVYTIRYSDERGLGVGNLENISVVGERIEEVTVSDFEAPASATNMLIRRVPGFLSRFLLNQLTIRLRVIESKCSGCFECGKICPAPAISMVGGIVTINQSICIQCMCCHEVCRYNAIVPKRAIVGRAIQFATNVLRKLMAAGNRKRIRHSAHQKR